MTNHRISELMANELASKIAKLSGQPCAIPVTLLAEAIRETLFPPVCHACGLLVCPNCDAHCMPGMSKENCMCMPEAETPEQAEAYLAWAEARKTVSPATHDNEKLDYCVGCETYVLLNGDVRPVDPADTRVVAIQNLKAEEKQSFIQTLRGDAQHGNDPEDKPVFGDKPKYKEYIN